MSTAAPVVSLGRRLLAYFACLPDCPLARLLDYFGMRYLLPSHFFQKRLACILGRERSVSLGPIIL